MNSTKQTGRHNNKSTSAGGWHAMDRETVFRHLNSTPEGLTEEQTAYRLNEYGPNQLPESSTQGPWARFLYQFHNVLIYVLLFAGVLTAFLGHWLDSGVIFAVVIINALIGFIQEGKAEDALKAIHKMLVSQAMVLRNGQRQLVDSVELVPGDIVYLQSGDKVPADLRLFQVKNLQIQESALTGESVAVEKSTEAVAESTVLGERYNMAFSGTLVTYGQGAGIVVATGGETEIGQISSMLAEVNNLTTPLLRQMEQFARWLTLGIFILAFGTFLFGIYIRDYLVADMFMAAVGLAVAAIPEGLPAIMSITLAIGVQKMARRNAIIRRLPAVETLGSVTVICTDKTGTLTKNEMTVQSLTTAEHLLDITGVGYNPHGSFLLAQQSIVPAEFPVLNEILRASILCNDAVLTEMFDEQGKAEWIMQGDPTEGALLTLGIKGGLEPEFEKRMWPRSDIIPFESEHQFMATLHHGHNGQVFAYIKGAPERLLEMCSKQKTEHGDINLEHQYWIKQVNDMAGRGQRVLAIAQKAFPVEHLELQFSDLQDDLVLLGLIGIIDPPRDDAIKAVRSCKNAGIQVKMITGDHLTTALAIGQKMGIGDGQNALSGNDIEAMDDNALCQAAVKVDVFARSSPEHKLRLVKALQSMGHIVAMTGDGVNDAPALKRADVGTAMGKNGTEVAKEAAEMVLADDNFSSIADAVLEGRAVYDNLRKAILFILPTNAGEALIIMAAIAMGYMLPITAVQILWVNMITAVTLALALAFEPPEHNIIRRPPRDSHEPILTGLFIWRIVFVAMILVAGTFGLFLWEMQQGASIELARTIAVNTLVMFEIFYLFNSRYMKHSVLNVKGMLGNPYALISVSVLLVLQLAFTYFGPMQKLFDSVPIDALSWLKIMAIASTVLFLVEMEKAVLRWLDSR